MPPWHPRHAQRRAATQRDHRANGWRRRTAASFAARAGAMDNQKPGRPSRAARLGTSAQTDFSFEGTASAAQCPHSRACRGLPSCASAATENLAETSHDDRDRVSVIVAGRYRPACQARGIPRGAGLGVASDAPWPGETGVGSMARRIAREIWRSRTSAQARTGFGPTCNRRLDLAGNCWSGGPVTPFPTGRWLRT